MGQRVVVGLLDVGLTCGLMMSLSGDLGTRTVGSLPFAQDGAFVPVVEILMVASVFFSCIA